MRITTLITVLTLTGLTACSAGAPRAPLGLHRQPANPDQAKAAMHTGDHTPEPVGADGGAVFPAGKADSHR